MFDLFYHVYNIVSNIFTLDLLGKAMSQGHIMSDSLMIVKLDDSNHSNNTVESRDPAL